ncbi:MAG: hypothetical protein R3185_09285, partial [Candidatus Thermoplasmatota archaeon]|nr:hypothetical protein [Candidatus Thermoplasmatota archaeon]
EEPGTYHLRGHLRISAGEDQVEYWSEELTLEVTGEPSEEDPASTRPTYTLTVSEVPANVTVAQNFTLNLTIEGEENRTTDHIGAHYGDNSTEEASFEVYNRACFHLEGELPGTYTVTCQFEEAGTHHLRGHMRLTLEDEVFEYWSQEVAITAS